MSGGWRGKPRSWDHHPPCPGGCGELADECCCARPNPLGSMRIVPPVGSGRRSALFPPGEPCHGCHEVTGTLQACDETCDGLTERNLAERRAQYAAGRP